MDNFFHPTTNTKKATVVRKTGVFFSEYYEGMPYYNGIDLSGNIYNRQDLVSYNNALYACKKTFDPSVVGEQVPSEDSIYWYLVIKGIKGDKGDPGEKGDKGDTGEKGEKGNPGKDGKDGEQGVTGLTGRTGASGKDGKNGLNGLDGKDGKDGNKILFGIRDLIENPCIAIETAKELDYYINTNTGDIFQLKAYNADGLM